MKFTGFCLITENVPALVRYYSKVFGCEAQGDDWHSEFSIGGVGLAIFSKVGMEQLAPGSMQNAGTGCVTIGFEVEDVDAEYERLKSLGVDFVKLPKTHPWGSRSLWFRDPDGNIIDFFCSAAPEAG